MLCIACGADMEGRGTCLACLGGDWGKWQPLPQKPDTEREDFVRQNAISIVKDLENRVENQKRSIATLELSRAGLRTENAKLREAIREIQLLSTQGADSPLLGEIVRKIEHIARMGGAS